MNNTTDWYLWPMLFFEEHHNRLASGFSQWQCPEVGHDAVIGQLHRDIRSRRLYDGAPEVMKLVIARDLIS